MREKNDLKTRLWAVQNEAKLAQQQAAKWEEERTKALAQTVREKQCLESTVTTLRAELNRAGEAQKAAISERLATVASKDKVISKQAAELEALRAEGERAKRCEYVLMVGPMMEEKMKAIASALHEGLCRDYQDIAKKIYGPQLAPMQGTNPKLIQMVSAMKEAVSGDRIQVSTFVKAMNKWKAMRNKVAHEPRAYLTFAEKSTYESYRPDIDRALTTLDQYLILLQSPRDLQDRQQFLRNVAHTLVDKW